MVPEHHDVGMHWENASRDWIAWTRTPGHDAFWSYRERFRSFVPAPGEATLDVGCGEGRIARELADLGHRVTAVDLSPTLIAAARDTSSGHHHVRADAEHLPFADGSFDRVVAYNMLMDVADMPAALQEMGRVLRARGLLTLSVVHPLADRGRFVSDGGFLLHHSYLEERYVRVAQTRDGLSMDWAGWARPLPDYVAALRAAGLAIIDLVEPPPDAADSRRGSWNRVPLFCWITAVSLR